MQWYTLYTMKTFHCTPRNGIRCVLWNLSFLTVLQNTLHTTKFFSVRCSIKYNAFYETFLHTPCINIHAHNETLRSRTCNNTQCTLWNCWSYAAQYCTMYAMKPFVVRWTREYTVHYETFPLHAIQQCTHYIIKLSITGCAIAYTVHYELFHCTLSNSIHCIQRNENQNAYGQCPVLTVQRRPMEWRIFP